MITSLNMFVQRTHRMSLVYDAEIGQRYVPNLNARIPNDYGGYFVTTNSLGFRSDVEFENIKGKRPRILFFGDSNTGGDGVCNSDRYSDIIGGMLDCEVYNYGLSGSGTDQQLLLMERVAQNVEADLIVLGVTIHNIERNKISHRESIERSSGKTILVPKPYFTIENEELVLNHIPVPKIRPYTDQDISGNLEEGLNDVKNHSNLVDIYNKFPQIKNILSPFSGLKSSIKNTLKKSMKYQPYPDYDDETSTGFKLLDLIVKRFIKAASPIPVLIIPIPMRIYIHGLASATHQSFFDKIADSNDDAHSIDITTALSELVKDQTDIQLFLKDGHYSPVGHDNIARLIVDKIKSKNLIRKKENGLKKISEIRKKEESIYVLGISAFYHNSAACLIKDGRIIAASEEERFSRIKNDRGFPSQAINFCLEQGEIQQNDLSALVYYDNAYLTFERLLHSQFSAGSKGEKVWNESMPSWVSYKLQLPRLIRRNLKYNGLILHEIHHRSHAASAFFPSPFTSAAILTIDGVGEWATASIGIGKENSIKLLKEMHFPHSLGLLYSAFTQFTGFKVNSGEYKMMGLAPYGEPKYVDIIYNHLIDLKDDGSLELNMDYFAFLHEPKMTNEKFAKLFDGPSRVPDSQITRREMDIARSIQEVTEEVILRMARHAHEITGEQNLCLAGGVALNCVANGRLLREGPFKRLWIQPAAGDSGCALGAALDAYHTYFDKSRIKGESEHHCQQGGSYLGPAYSDNEIRSFLDTYDYPYHEPSQSERAEKLASILAEGKVIGHFSGRAEFGPRSLGARSILADARNRDMQVKLNLKIKYRESFRPFAPTVLKERVSDYFELDRQSPYMLLVAPVKEDRRVPFNPEKGDDLLPTVKMIRSDIPAVTHVDYSARIQTIKKEDHPDYYELIAAFEKLTGCGVIVNTSFNVRGEPIVCTPFDAYRCFMRTEMDVLVLGKFLLFKGEQPCWPEDKGHVEENDDPKQAVSENEFTDQINEFFRTEFLPLAKKMKNSDTIHELSNPVQKNSGWMDSKELSTEEIFTIPEILNRDLMDAEKMAKAIVTYWKYNDHSAEQISFISKLLKLGMNEKYEELKMDETVSDSVYVMY